MVIHNTFPYWSAGVPKLNVGLVRTPYPCSAMRSNTALRFRSM